MPQYPISIKEPQELMSLMDTHSVFRTRGHGSLGTHSQAQQTSASLSHQVTVCKKEPFGYELQNELA